MTIFRLDKKGFLYEIVKNRILYLMFLPVGIYFFLFAYLPMPGAIVAFKNYTYDGGLLFSDWCGFDNFRFLFLSGKIYRLAFNTVAYNIVFLCTYILSSIFVALLISEMKGNIFKKISGSGNVKYRENGNENTE